MLGHVTFWLASLVIALICLARAWKIGEGGLDDQQNVRDPVKFGRSKVWVGIGAAFVIFAFYDIFTFFNPPPPLMR